MLKAAKPQTKQPRVPVALWALMGGVVYNVVSDQNAEHLAERIARVINDKADAGQDFGVIVRGRVFTNKAALAKKAKECKSLKVVDRIFATRDGRRVIVQAGSDKITATIVNGVKVWWKLVPAYIDGKLFVYPAAVLVTGKDPIHNLEEAFRDGFGVYDHVGCAPACIMESCDNCLWCGCWVGGCFCA